MFSKTEASRMPTAQLRSIVFEALKSEPKTQYAHVCANVANILVKRKIVEDPDRGAYQSSQYPYELAPEDREMVREIIWDLVIERVLTLGIDDGECASWPFLMLTKYGQEIANSDKPIPHDPAGYLKRIQDEIPSIDCTILTYLQESIETYNINKLLSSTITLGCASEKALLLVIESYKNAIEDEERRSKFSQKTDGKMIKRQYDEFCKAISNLKPVMPVEVMDGLDNVLLGVFEIIRNNRNDAGHPTGKTISREYAFANLQVFIPYCKKVYQLIDWFDGTTL